MLRPVAKRDAAALFVWRGDPEVMRWWDWNEQKDAAEIEAIIAEHKAERARGATLWWVMVRTADGAVIGECDLSEIDEQHRRAEIGFIVARPHWRQGYAAEAMRAVIAHATGPLGLERLSARAHAGNEASRRLLEKLGFAHEGTLRGSVLRDGERRDCLMFGRLSLPSVRSSRSR